MSEVVSVWTSDKSCMLKHTRVVRGSLQNICVKTRTHKNKTKKKLLYAIGIVKSARSIWPLGVVSHWSDKYTQIGMQTGDTEGKTLRYNQLDSASQQSATEDVQYQICILSQHYK